jgi:drug/metabolite transporter (DMT)-like permease
MDAQCKIASATIAALIGFAANSILCRMALGARTIDAWSFTAVRLGAGALTLFCVARVFTRDRAARRAGSLGSAFALFLYAAAFSLAYLRIPAGVGALLLFASVQATMIGWSIVHGERPSSLEWLGLTLALAGLVLLALPGAVAPDPIGASLMMLAGVAWGAYSLRGKSSHDPLAATAVNFLYSAPLAVAGLCVGFSGLHATPRGVGLAILSGAVASGLGYSLWYRALPYLSATRAALVQLVVPALAAGAGVVLLGEQLSLRLALAGSMILGGVALAVVQKRRAPR